MGSIPFGSTGPRRRRSRPIGPMSDPKAEGREFRPVIGTMIVLIIIFALFNLLDCRNVQCEPIEASIPISWTASGDDGTYGTASVYDGRYSVSLDSLTNHWDRCAIWLAEGTMNPKPSGSAEWYTFNDTLETCQAYYFALRIGDELCLGERNWSNTVVLKQWTVRDTIPPGDPVP